MHGLKGPKMVELATGLGTHELLADVLLGARLFHEMYQCNYQYVLKKYVFETSLINHSVEGTLQSSLDCPALRDLDSTWLISPVVKPGEHLEITRDLASAAGIVFQVHADYKKCLEDIEAIERMEREGLYDVEDSSSLSSGSPIGTTDSGLKRIDHSTYSADSTIFADSGELSDSGDSTVMSFPIAAPQVQA
jgi:hypothetical protein